MMARARLARDRERTAMRQHPTRPLIERMRGVSLLLSAVLCVGCGGGGGGAPQSSVPPAAPPAAPPQPSSPNRPPILVKPIPDQRGGGGRAFSLDVSQSFEDPDG